MSNSKYSSMEPMHREHERMKFCVKCDFTTRRKSTLNNHIECVHCCDNWIGCPGCALKVHSECHWKEPMHRKHERMRFCVQCELTTRQKSTLNAHKECVHYCENCASKIDAEQVRKEPMHRKHRMRGLIECFLYCENWIEGSDRELEAHKISLCTKQLKFEQGGMKSHDCEYILDG